MNVFIKPVGPIGTNCYIVADDEKKCVVIDPGAQPEKLIGFLKSKDLIPQYVLLTHGHYDHIGGVKGIVKEYGCQIAIGRNDAEQLTNSIKSLAAFRGLDDETYVMTPDLLLKEGDVITAGTLSFEVLDTPGHTCGGVTYCCGDLLFTGDTLFAGSVGRTDLYGGDFRALISSVKKLASLEGDYQVLSGHGPESTLDVERRSNPYLTRNFDNDNFY